MPGLQYKPPVRAILNDRIYPGGKLTVREAGEDMPAKLFADPWLSAPMPNPLQANVAGIFPAVYLDPVRRYDITLTDSLGNTLREENDFLPLIAPLTLGDLQPRGPAGAPLPSARYTFYEAETAVLTDIFADEALTLPLDNPITANSAGEFPDIWLDAFKCVRVILQERSGVLVFDLQQYQFRTDILPPSAPVLSGALNDDDIDLSWTASTSEFGTVAGYRLYNADDDSLIVDQPGRTYIDGPLEEGFTYSYYVIAYDANGNESQRSNIVSISVNALIEIITSTREWIRPANLISAKVSAIAAGAGGGSGGATTGSGFPRSGGGGGGGGISEQTFAADDLPDVVTVTVGIGGQGGNAVISTYGDTAGQYGAHGGDSSFGSLLTAQGGRGGGRGYMSDFTGGAGGVGTLENGGAGGDGAVSNSASTGESGKPGTNTLLSGPGGGGGGPLDRFNVPGGAGKGGSSADGAGGAAGAGTASITSPTTGDPGLPGDDGHDHTAGGGGGGGGCAGSQAAAKSAMAGAGASGGKYGAGGGGGGAAQSGSSETATSGAGGNGANGVVILRYTYAT